MKVKIENIADLRTERIRLKNRLEVSKSQMRGELNAIKTELNPARQAVGVLGDMFTTPRKGLLPMGVGFGVDMIVRRGLLARAGWLPRLIVPFLVRNVATKYIQNNKSPLLETALTWVKESTDKKDELTKQPSINSMQNETTKHTKSNGSSLLETVLIWAKEATDKKDELTKQPTVNSTNNHRKTGS